MKKYAYFSIDIERFSDTECVAKSGQKSNVDIMDGLDKYIELLDKHGIKATLFCLRDTAIKHKEQIRRHLLNGHRLALHGNRHTPPTSMDDATFAKEIKSAKQSLEQIFNTKILGYRAPFFALDNSKLRILKELGFKYDSSLINFSPARHTTIIDVNRFQKITDTVFVQDTFHEFGHATSNAMKIRFPLSGGGYIRLSNWFFSKFLLWRYIKKHDYYMFYLHPFELSKKKLPKIKKLKFYDKMYLGYGFRTLPFKINYIIKRLKKEGYSFTTFEQAVEQNLYKKEAE